MISFGLNGCYALSRLPCCRLLSVAMFHHRHLPVLVKHHPSPTSYKRHLNRSHDNSQKIYVRSFSNSGQESEEQSVSLSDRCVKRLKEVTADDKSFLRIAVEGGGCSGFQYTFTLDTQVNADDCIITKDDVRVVIDKTSLEFMRGAIVDYNEELIRSSFQVISNPKADKGCSCGASFNIKL